MVNTFTKFFNDLPEPKTNKPMMKYVNINYQNEGETYHIDTDKLAQLAEKWCQTNYFEFVQLFNYNIVSVKYNKETDTTDYVISCDILCSLKAKNSAPATSRSRGGRTTRQLQLD